MRHGSRAGRRLRWAARRGVASTLGSHGTRRSTTRKPIRWRRSPPRSRCTKAHDAKRRRRDACGVGGVDILPDDDSAESPSGFASINPPSSQRDTAPPYAAFSHYTSFEPPDTSRTRLSCEVRPGRRRDPCCRNDRTRSRTCRGTRKCHRRSHASTTGFGIRPRDPERAGTNSNPGVASGGRCRRLLQGVPRAIPR